MQVKQACQAGAGNYLFYTLSVEGGTECQGFGHYSVKWNLFGANEMGFNLLDPNAHVFFSEKGN